MAAERELRTKATMDTRDYERGASKLGTTTDRVGGKFSNFSNKVKGYAKVAGLALAGIGAKWVSDGTRLAGETQENLSKVQAVYGRSAASIDKFSKTTATSLGISRRAALEAAGGFGNMFDQLGVGERPAADMSKRMLTLAADLGSFNNADPTEVIETMGAAFRGEFDAVQKFIPTMSAARVEQEAMRASGKKSAKELTAQEKALATYQVMVKDAGKANGDFARTQDQQANQSRIAKARAEDLQASIGKKLLPIQTKLYKVLNDQVLPAVSAVAGFLGKYSGILVPVAAAIATIVTVVKAWSIAQGILNTVLAANPIVLIAAGIAGLVAALVLAYQKVEWFRDGVDAAFRAIRTVVTTVVDFIKRYWALLLPILLGPIGAAITLIIKHWDKVKAAAGVLVSAVTGSFRTLASVVSGIITRLRSAWDGFTGFLRGSVSVVKSLMSAVGAAFRGPLNTARDVVSGIKGTFDGLVGFFRGLPERIGRWVRQMVEKITGPVNAVIRGINSIGFNIPKLTIGGGSFLGRKLPSYTIPGTGRRFDPIPHIPELAAGGIVRGSRSGTLVRAGENYTDEVIGPLNRLGGIGATNNTYFVTVEVAPGADPVRAGAETVTAIKAYERVNGASWRTGPT